MDELMHHPEPSPFPQHHSGLASFFPLDAEASAGLSDVTQKRREQIVDAAEAIIAEEGIHELSLGRIENRLGGMSHGQLTYYFPSKESILLAVLERMLRKLIGNLMHSEGPKPLTGRAWECFREGLTRQLNPAGQTAGEKNLFSLLYTFLAQMGHRPDYRVRLAHLHGEIRNFIVTDIAGDVSGVQSFSPQVAASLIHALFHGLGMQLAVNAAAFDRDEMFSACIQLFAPLLDRKSTSEIDVLTDPRG